MFYITLFPHWTSGLENGWMDDSAIFWQDAGIKNCPLYP